MYFPVLVIAMPEAIEVSMTPAIIGSMSRPDWVTPAPVAICRNVGRNASAANMPMPMTRPMTVETVKTELRNSRMGSTGSVARSSTTTNSTHATSVPAISATSRVSPRSYAAGPCSPARRRG